MDTDTRLQILRSAVTEARDAAGWESEKGEALAEVLAKIDGLISPAAQPTRPADFARVGNDGRLVELMAGTGTSGRRLISVHISKDGSPALLRLNSTREILAWLRHAATWQAAADTPDGILPADQPLLDDDITITLPAKNAAIASMILNKVVDDYIRKSCTYKDDSAREYMKRIAPVILGPTIEAMCTLAMAAVPRLEDRDPEGEGINHDVAFEVLAEFVGSDAWKLISEMQVVDTGAPAAS